PPPAAPHRPLRPPAVSPRPPPWPPGERPYPRLRDQQCEPPPPVPPRRPVRRCRRPPSASLPGESPRGTTRRPLHRDSTVRPRRIAPPSLCSWKKAAAGVDPPARNRAFVLRGLY